MFNFMITATKYVLADWQRFLIGGLIVISAIIAIEGILKAVLFNKVKNKTLKKVLLAFSSIALVFPTSAVYLWLEKIPFDYYWYSVLVLSILTVLSYWLYENTAFRNLFSFVSKKILIKLRDILDKAFSSDTTDLTKEISTAYAELKKDTQKKLSETKNTDLKNL